MKARGIDIDPESIRATQDNARLNHVSVAADMTPLAEVVGSFDLVVANLFAEVLVDLSEDLKRVTGSHLAVAGVLADRAESVVEALKPMRLVRRELEGDWCHMGFEW
jgi:ribosomal protein L11 methyltransferase